MAEDFSTDFNADFASASANPQPTTTTTTSGVSGPLVTEGSAPAYGVAPVIVTAPPVPQRTVDLSDKALLINQALINTGNTPVNVPDDGSAEWTVASSGFDQWARTLLYNFDFRFSSTMATLPRFGDSPFPGFSDVYDKPGNCLFLRTACRADEAAFIQPAIGFGMPDFDTRLPPLDYRLINDQIHCVAPQGLLALYVPFPTGSQPWSVGFTDALRMFVEATILRGLNEDESTARTRLAEAKEASELAASRDGAQEPRRIMFRSSVLERRRTRGGGGYYR